MLVLLLATALAGRHAIQGQVIDRNGDPIDRAIVSLAPGNVELVTDREGRYLIDYLRNEKGDRTRLARKTDYTLEVFRPGYHTASTKFFFKRGELTVDTLTLAEESITVPDAGENLDPEIYKDPTHASGANYEGQ
ncbi:MAG: carboxypeptidase regulatory-like domain-containing protein [Alphaproteobacteria bacterium]|nr:carboxypeptidase regulatory-like domain-containing protein [Alphaproteobacteria bacterium]